MISKGISKDLAKNLIDFQENFKGIEQEFDCFFMDSKGLTMNLIDFQKNFWGFAKKFDRFSQGFGKECIWFLKNVVKIFSIILKDLSMNFFDF